MASIIVNNPVDLDDPVLVEGLPGVGLVGKIATDHLVETFDMTYHAHIDCEGLPRVAVYDTDRTVRAPVRIYADEERDLYALQSDVPVSHPAAPDFADCVNEWVADEGILPLYLSGFPVEQEPDEIPETYGVSVGDVGGVLDDHDVPEPEQRGVVSGPTGALLNRANATDTDAVGLVVESNPQFPDPAAARQLILEGINPLADVEVPTEELVDRAEEIQEQREELARRMREAAEEESSQAQPMQGMYR
ncbi:MAG: proteasome assembly chaperone family protein [Halobacteriaceae archaeon]